ncbi:MAG: discoidin domain-containing protein, partial [Candidatus Poribacteria bacterium]|nr:discoidin domain-containing protein [Candidatus Poribacteria bacterium]
MDTRLLVFLAGLGLIGFLVYPRQERIAAPGQDLWIATARKVDGETLHFPRTQRTDPIYQTYDLGFIYRLERAEVKFENPGDNPPRLFDIIVSPTRSADYRRAFSFRAASRSYALEQWQFQDTYEARWVQVVVNDWFSGKPKFGGIQFGARYSRDWNSIRAVTTSHNAPRATLLFDGLTTEPSKWSGAKTEEETVEQDGKKTKTTMLRPPGSPVWLQFDLGGRQTVYGLRLTTDGPGNNVRRYRVLTSLDGGEFIEQYVSNDLPDETRADRVRFTEEPNEPPIARFVRIEMDEGWWHGEYPELREVEIFTDAYRLPPDRVEVMADYTPVLVRKDNPGIDNRRAPNLSQGFPFDRGEQSDAAVRHVWNEGDDVEPGATEAQRTFAYHYDAVTFQYNRLDPDRLYWLQITYLQNKDGKRLQNLLADGYLLHGDSLPIPSGNPQPVTLFVPQSATADGALEVSINRLAGANAVVSEIALFEA